MGLVVGQHHQSTFGRLGGHDGQVSGHVLMFHDRCPRLDDVPDDGVMKPEKSSNLGIRDGEDAEPWL